jgi:hypothetical protein
MGRQEQWEAYQDVKAKYQEACDELTKALGDLDEARALPKKVWIVRKNFEVIIGCFDTKEKAVAELDSWEMSLIDEDMFDIKEVVVR